MTARTGPGASRSAGFTLLEVLVALVIVGVAVTTFLQLASQGLRLLKLSGEHQEAVLLADRIAREADPSAEDTQTGEESGFTWERRVTLVPVAAELTAPGVRAPLLFSVTVTVRWGTGRSVELATLRASLPAALPGAGGTPGQPAGVPTGALQPPSTGTATTGKA